MKVYELIQKLREENQNADVYIVLDGYLFCGDWSVNEWEEGKVDIDIEGTEV